MITQPIKLTSPIRYNGFTRCRTFVINPASSAVLKSKLDTAGIIIDYTFKKLGVDPVMLTFKTRKREVVDARRISAYLCLTCIDITENQLNIKFGLLNRSSLNYFKTTCEELVVSNAKINKTVAEIMKELELTPVIKNYQKK